jgi:hypothetical protein
MAIKYASSRSYTATTINDKPSLMAAINSALVGAGWTVIVNTSSTDKIYQCVLTPQNNQICVRVWDGGGNCLRLRMMNTVMTISQTDSCYLFPAVSTVYGIIANPYQFAIFVPGSVSSRNFCIASALYIPSFLISMGLTTCAFIMGDSGSDTDTSSTRGSFRTSLNSRGLVGYSPSQGWTLLNNTAVEYSNLSADSSIHPGLPAFVSFQSTAIQSISGYRWHDNSALITEPLIAWGAPNIDDEAKIRGQLWDSFIATESYPADITTTVDGHTYYNLTNSNDGNATLPASMRGSLFMVTV